MSESKLLTPAGLRALQRAAKRESGNVCPTGIKGGAEAPMLARLLHYGFITDTHAPQITDKGRAALTSVTQP